MKDNPVNLVFTGEKASELSPQHVRHLLRRIDGLVKSPSIPHGGRVGKTNNHV